MPSLLDDSEADSNYVDVYINFTENKFYYYTDKQIDVSEKFPSYISDLFKTELIKLKRDKKLNNLLDENHL